MSSPLTDALNQGITQVTTTVSEYREDVAEVATQILLAYHLGDDEFVTNTLLRLKYRAEGIEESMDRLTVPIDDDDADETVERSA